jgi:hypothetical protein
MSSPTLSVPASIKFDEAINLTQTFIAKLKNNELTADKILEFVSELVQTPNGARGFFVTYLTAPDPICDDPHPEIITALQTHPEIVAELLVKNLAMSTAQQLYHQRRTDREMAASSAMVATRTTKIIQELDLPQIQVMCRELVASDLNGAGAYAEFLTRWGYDEEQKKAIDRVLIALVDSE